MLPMARAAQLAGHNVVVASGPDLAPLVERRGFAVWSAGPHDGGGFRPTR
jgi:UDP:flavonoid glycosyltransferase YjiC (YdhE family)